MKAITKRFTFFILGVMILPLGKWALGDSRSISVEGVIESVNAKKLVISQAGKLMEFPIATDEKKVRDTLQQARVGDSVKIVYEMEIEDVQLNRMKPRQLPGMADPRQQSADPFKNRIQDDRIDNRYFQQS